MRRIGFWAKGVLIAATILPLLLVTPIPTFTLPVSDDDGDVRAMSELGAPLPARRALEGAGGFDWRTFLATEASLVPLAPLFASALPSVLVSIVFFALFVARNRGPPWSSTYRLPKT